MEKIKPYLQLPSKAPYAWFVYSSIFQATSIILGTGEGRDLISYIFVTSVNAVPAIALIIQIVANTVRLVKERPKFNFKKILINIILLAIVSFFGSLISK